MLSRDEAAALLDELCVRYGVCLTPQDLARLTSEPPGDPAAFVDDVLRAEFGESQPPLRLRREIRDLVGEAFRVSLEVRRNLGD